MRRTPGRFGAAALFFCLGSSFASAQPDPGRFSLGLDGALDTAAPYRRELAAPSLDAPPPKSSTRRFLTAAGELALAELVPWAWDRYVEDEDFARISWSTVSANLKTGLTWDDDKFETNQSLHPFQGSLYFQSGRSNGFTYWESGLFALTGSLIWEFAMENSHPSTNDLLNTTLGGMVRGEVQYRLAEMLLDNTATGGDRFWRELGAAFLNPMGAITRLVDGDMARVFPNPPDRLPDGFTLAVELGYRHVGDSPEDPDQALVALSARYGDPFAKEVRAPFESFAALLELALPEHSPVTRFEERGLLRSWDLNDHAAPTRHVFGLSQEYVYIQNDAEVFGAQMFSAGLLSRFPLPGGLAAVTDLEALAAPITAIQTTEAVNPRTGRDYDFGPGGGVLAGVLVERDGREVLDAGYGVVWSHTVNGTSDHNTAQFLRATAVIPIAGPFGLGGGYRWYSRKSSFADGRPASRQTQSEWRAFVSLTFGTPARTAVPDGVIPDGVGSLKERFGTAPTAEIHP